MSVESIDWETTPGYEDLEYQVQTLHEHVIEGLEACRETTGGLIDIEFELQHPDLIEYSNVLTTILGHGEDPTSRQIAYRAVHFAFLTSEQVLDTPRINVLCYFDSEVEAQEQQARIARDTQDYLQHRPTLDAIVGRYIPEIDGSCRHAALVEKIAALTFIQIEIMEKRQFTDNVVDAFGDALDAWDGSFHED
jgi:hypothetical protein